ncbi:MAG: hypothetical protein H0W83_17405, partial [Planctomycetes bacterium]|nr:hypothetical protein [Planctomycetota bacterium]
MAATIDILGLGCTSVDDVLFVDVVADADGKQPVIRRERHFGGLTATALVAAARLGARCAYAGILGDDPLSAAVIENLAREGIAVTSVPRVVGGAPVYATIVVAARPPSRTIYYSIP